MSLMSNLQNILLSYTLWLFPKQESKYNRLPRKDSISFQSIYLES